MHPLDLHVFRGDTQKLGNAHAQKVGLLGVGPNFDLVTANVNDATRRSYAGM